VLDSAGSVCEIQGLFWDVTAEDAEQRSRAARTTEAALEHVSEGVLICQGRRIQTVNRAARALLGADAVTEVVGHQLEEFVVAGERAAFVRRMKTLSPTRTMSIRTKLFVDGRVVGVTISAGRLPADGEIEVIVQPDRAGRPSSRRSKGTHP
jgi:PAS domain S-box-containing protein